jgi:hypothetical protein
VYHGQSVVKMWVFSKNTIAGDLGVTPIIQCLASMLITSTLVHSDLHASSIKPLPYVYPHVDHLPDPRLLLSKSYHLEQRKTTDEKETAQLEYQSKKGFKYYYWMLIRFIFEGTERNMLLAKPGFLNWLGRFLWTAAQGALIGIIFGFPIWCLAIVILGPIYGNGNMGNQWAPQVIKLVYGAIVGWVTNPVIAILALGSQADHHLIMVENEQDEEATTGIDGAGNRVETIQEEEVEIGSGSTLVPSTPVPTTNSPLTRPRAISNLSTSSRSRPRPPLTANVSRLSPLPPPFLNLPNTSPGELPTPTRPTTRERGLTISSMGSNHSYVLGGTGGRAQRPRAGTTTSAYSEKGVPEVMVSRPSQGLDTAAGEGRAGAGSVDVFGRRVTAPSGVPTVTNLHRPNRPRSASTLAALGEVVEPKRE